MNLLAFLKKVNFLIDKPYRTLFASVSLFAFLSILDLVSIGLVGPLFSLLVEPKNQSNVTIQFFQLLRLFGINQIQALPLAISLALIFCIKAYVAIKANQRVIKFSLGMQFELRERLAKDFFARTYLDVRTQNSAHFVEITHRLVEQFCAGVVIPILRLVGDLFVTICILALLFFESPMILLITASILGVTVFGLNFLLREKSRKYGELTNTSSLDVLKGINNSVRSYLEIKVFGREQWAINNVSNPAQTFAKYYSKALTINVIPKYVLEISVIFVLLACTAYGNTQKIPFDDLIPTFAIFAIAALRLLPIANVTANSLIQINYGKNGVDRLFEEFSKCSIKPSEKLEDKSFGLSEYTIPKFNSFQFEDVSFGYNQNQPQILNGVTFNISRGDTIGIVGPSGSGKSTIIAMMLGLIRPDTGRLLFNGQIIDAPTEKLLPIFSYMPQEPFIFEGTLLENIALCGKEQKIDAVSIEKAVNMASLSDFVLRKKDGLSSKVADRGANLSGGQRQRVALARTFYFGREVFIFDESTNSLDVEVEAEVLAQIQLLKKLEKTVVIVSHNPSVETICDKLVELK